MSPKLTKKDIQLFNVLHDSQVEDAKTFSKPKYAMYWTSIVDKYKEKAHFIYELLQNADDAQASEVAFQLYEDRLVFRHNGIIGFSVTSDEDEKHKGHINAITGIGWTTKDKDTEKIGKFGVGFKAVFQYTKEPRIYDDKFWFKIEDYIVPTWLHNDFPNRKDGETVFEFPFTNPKEAFQDISNRLSTLDNPILFLRHLQKVSIYIPNKEEIKYSKKVVDKEKLSGITHELIRTNNNLEKQTIHLFTKTVNVIYKGQNSVQNISIGYPVNEEGDIDFRGKFKVFCFFPTEEDFDLRCIVHAPFLLVDSRQSIKQDPVNTTLKEKLAELAADALPILRDYGLRHDHLLINENIFHMIPERKIQRWGIYDYEDDPFRERYLEIIRDEKLLLSRESNYISCEEALVCRPLSLMSIITDAQLNELYNIEGDKKHFLNESIQRIYSQKYVSDVLDELEIKIFTGTDLAHMLTSEFMNRYGFTWAKRLYSHLRNEEVRLYKRTKEKGKIEDTPFLLSPIILTSQNEWIAPYLDNGSYNVYLPLSSNATGYNFVSNKYDEDNELRSFLGDLNLKTPDEWDYIQSVLNTYYGEGDIDTKKLKNDFEIIYNYVLKLSESEKTAKLKLISKGIYISCDDDLFRLPYGVYLNEKWLKDYFGDSVAFVNYDFYDDFINKHSLSELIHFLEELGIKKGPEVKEDISNWIFYSDKERFSIEKCTGGSITDYILEGFDKWHNINIDTSKALWQWLSEHVSVLEEHKLAVCQYQYYSWYTKRATSKLTNDLRTKEWLFNSHKKLVASDKIHIEDLEELGYNMNYSLIKLIGIERATKSLKELGATETQIQQNKLGQFAAGLGLDSEDKLREALEALNEKRKNAETRRHSTSAQVNSHAESQEDSSNEPFNGQQRSTSLEEMSSSTKSYSSPRITHPKSTNERIEEINQRLTDEANKKIAEESKRASVADITKYTKKWFDTLLDLEYNSTTDEIDYRRNSIKITFTSFKKEQGSKQVYVLSNPSRNIPIWIEDVEGLSIKFTFSNQEDLSLTFEVANVKDFNLRVKARAADVDKIDSLDWAKCTKAVVELNSPIQIVGRLKTAFQSLEYSDDFNFKNNLTNRISFVFGPPGTGKTTRLSEIIRENMKSSNCRMLVLAPTNKACDVLTKMLLKTEEPASWLGRFVATGDEKIDDSIAMIDRDSELYLNDKCCIVSTIARLPYDGFTQSEQHKLLKDINWDIVIVDEASMIPVVQIVYAIYKIQSAKFIIAGDPLQIQPIVREDAWKGENIFTMVNLDNFESPTTEPIQFEVERLGIQYRSIPSIANLYNYYSYEGKLKNARNDKDMRVLPMGVVPTKAVNFIPFKVERYDSIFGAKRLQGSNVHIYSAIFAVESCTYIAKQQTDNVKIGIICPYAPQAQLINKLISQRSDIPLNVDISVGTIHGFQGDQCDIIFAVFNPPTGIRAAAERIMLNNKNVINVAISRASDYLFILLPHPDSYGYENLIEINKLAKIANKHVSSVAVINADHVEKYTFNNPNYIESNTFVTTHQVANVYTKAACKYEVRIDDNAVDIQVGEEYGKEESANSIKTDSFVPEPSENSTTESVDKITKKEENVVTDNPDKIGNKAETTSVNSEKNSFEKELEREIGKSKQYKNPEMYSLLFEKYKIDLPEALDIVLNNDTICSLYIAFLIVGSYNYRRKFGWPEVTMSDITTRKPIISISEYKHYLYTWLQEAQRRKIFPIKGVNKLDMENVTLPMFQEAVKKRIEKQKRKEQRNKVKAYGPIHKHNNRIGTSVSTTSFYKSRYMEEEKEDDKLYNKYDYGLSDW